MPKKYLNAEDDGYFELSTLVYPKNHTTVIAEHMKAAKADFMQEKLESSESPKEMIPFKEKHLIESLSVNAKTDKM